MADKYAQHKVDVSKDESVNEVGGMSDVHIGAQEIVGDYTDEDGNLKMPKDSGGPVKGNPDPLVTAGKK